MDKMKEGLQRRARRMQENIQQSVGLSEKRDELQNVTHLEQRNQKIVSAIKNTRQNLQSCIRSGSKEDTLDKRKRRVEEYGLWQQLHSDAKEVENAFPRDEPPLLANILRMYGEVIGAIIEEKVLTEQLIEKNVIDAFTKYIEEEKALSKAKEKLTRTAVDAEVCRKRRQATHDEVKAHDIQDEYDKLQIKLDNCKDIVYADIYSLASKEAEMGIVFKDLVDAQIEYHRRALQKFENILPDIDRKIASYSRRPVFGCHLEDHLRHTNRSIATVLEVCCSALKRYGFNEKGLFRVNGHNNRIRRLKCAFDAHQITAQSTELSEYINDPHSICSVLKCYLRELPEPLMTHQLHSQWVHIARMDADHRYDAIKKLLPSLPEDNRRNLAYLIHFLKLMLNHQDQTMMNVGNLSIVFGPNLIDGGTETQSETMLGSKLVETLLINVDKFFPKDKFNFNFDSPLTDSFNQRLTDLSGGFEANERTATPQRSIQQSPNTTDNSSNSTIGSTAPVAAKLRTEVACEKQAASSTPSLTRPRCPAPPPPFRQQSSNITSAISSSLEHLNTSLMGKSQFSDSSSNDSMAEYAYSNPCAANDNSSAIKDLINSSGLLKLDVDESSSIMSRSLNEQQLPRPNRPPPPQYHQSSLKKNRSSNDDNKASVFANRPLSYMNAIDSLSQQQNITTTSAPPRTTTSISNNNQKTSIITINSADYPSQQSTTITKPHLPVKPRTTTASLNNEITKL